MLFVAEDNATVGKIGGGRFALHLACGLAVERQRDAVMLGKVQQARQDVVVAVGADDHVGIVVLQEMAYAKNELAAAGAREAQRLALDLDQ